MSPLEQINYLDNLRLIYAFTDSSWIRLLGINYNIAHPCDSAISDGRLNGRETGRERDRSDDSVIIRFSSKNYDVSSVV